MTALPRRCLTPTLVAAALAAAGCVATLSPPREPGLAAAAVDRPPVEGTPAPTAPRLALPQINLERAEKLKGQQTSVLRDPHCEQAVVPSIQGNLLGLTALLAEAELGNRLKKIGDSLKDRPRRSRPVDGWASVKVAARHLNWLPFVLEEKIGEHGHQQVADVLRRDSAPGRKLYPALDAALAALLARVPEQHDYTFKVHIRKRSETNAVAMPGGYLYVDQGLFDRASGRLTPEGHFALAHEVSHVLQRHETYNTQARILDSIESLEQGVALFKRVGERDPRAVDKLIRLFGSTRNRFGRFYAEQELHADSCALRLLADTFPQEADYLRIVGSFAERVARHPEHSDDHKDDLITIVNRPIDRHPGGVARMKNLQQSGRFWMQKRQAAPNAGRL
ncbi:M48 family metalloprotease [Aquabacterium sp. A08]|uniref:M48 family metalloprotease n=1 Tax=Aquabacterium sp. A08 TaxID=2718532 RepID=UPI00141FFBA6|nr:M48 family metalloprotease [Aquabacterium sp. A08]NIC42416.1 M48 family metalloprotease [Aquabacterium sp. A08]